MRNLFTLTKQRPAILAIADQGLASLSTFAFLAWSAYELAAPDFAVLSLLMMGVQLLLSLHRSFAIQPLGVFADSRHCQDIRSSARCATVVTFLVTLILISAVVGCGTFYGTSPKLLYLVALSFVGQSLYEIARRLCYVRQAGWVSIRYTALQCTSVWTLIALQGWVDSQSRLYFLFGSFAISNAVAGLYGSFSEGAIGSVRALVLRRFVREQWHAGAWMFFSQVGYWLSSQIYPFVLATVSLSYVADYNFAQALLNLFNPVKSAITSYFPVMLSRQEWRGSNSRHRRMLSLVASAGSIGLAALVLTAHFIVPVFYGDKYPWLIPLMAILAVATLASLLNSVLNSIQQVAGATKWAFYSNMCAAFLVFILLPEAVGVYGVLGAASVASVAASIVFAIQFLAFARR